MAAGGGGTSQQPSFQPLATMRLVCGSTAQLLPSSIAVLSVTAVPNVKLMQHVTAIRTVREDRSVTRSVHLLYESTIVIVRNDSFSYQFSNLYLTLVILALILSYNTTLVKFLRAIWFGQERYSHRRSSYRHTCTSQHRYHNCSSHSSNRLLCRHKLHLQQRQLQLILDSQLLRVL